MSVNRISGSVHPKTRGNSRGTSAALHAQGPGPAGPKAPRLGNTRKAFPASTPRAERWALRDTLNDVSSLERVRKCGKVPIANVALRSGPRGESPGYAGLSTCGSVWACPVCAAKIAAERRAEVAAVVERAIATGKTVSLLTLTQRHHRGQDLGDLWNALSHGWNKVTSGRRWQGFKDQLGLVGTVRSVEVTHGKHGWHVHTHVLVISEKDPSVTPIFWQRKQGRRRTPYPVEVQTSAEFVAERWAAGLAAHGVDFLKDRGGLDWETARDGHAAGRYVAKLGGAAEGEAQGAKIANETTLGAFKRARGENRTPFQILSDFAATGDVDDLRLWHIWEKKSKGRRALLWSQGLREWAKLGKERSDEEIAEDERGDEVIAVFTNDAWRQLRQGGGAATLLDVVESGGPRAGLFWLNRHKIPYSLPPAEDPREE